MVRIISAASYEQAIAILPDTRSPDSDQLKLMNNHRAKGANLYIAEEWIVAPMLASHNLLSHSKGVWDLESLVIMAEKFPGDPILTNHEWYEIESSQGFILDSFLIRTPEAPENILKAVDHEASNQRILNAAGGFIGLIVIAAISMDSAIAKYIQQRRARDVSTGTLTDGNITCPDCGLSFRDDEACCLPPSPFLQWWYGDDPTVRFAPYYIRGRTHTTVEVSSVVKGDLPGASIVGST